MWREGGLLRPNAPFGALPGTFQRQSRSAISSRTRLLRLVKKISESTIADQVYML